MHIPRLFVILFFLTITCPFSVVLSGFNDITEILLKVELKPPQKIQSINVFIAGSASIVSWPNPLWCVYKNVESVQCMFLSWLSNCGILIDPYLNEGLIRDRILLRLTAQGGATQMTQLLHGDQRKTERNKDVISMLSNVRIKTLFWIHASLWYQNGATTQNQLYVHVGDGSVDHAIFNFLCRFRCFCYIISKFICISVLDHAGFF